MSSNRTFLEQALGDADADADETPTALEQVEAGISARSTQIGGEDVDVADPITGPTFGDVGGVFAGDHGRPRPREFWTAKQLGRTPPMQVIKIVVAQQLTGGRWRGVNPDGELQGATADFAALLEDIYDGPHYQELSKDNLITTAVSDLVDLAWAYWEILPSANGEFPVAAFKPLPPLQIQHNLSDETGDFVDEPAFWQVPFRNTGNTISMDGEAEPLNREDVVVMRAPQSAETDRHYGQSIATKVREWLEIIIDVDVHLKRHYDDSQLPAGLLHFTQSLGDDKMQQVEDDIREAAGDPHELVSVDTDADVKWVPIGDSVVDLDAIQEQTWYMKLVLAAAGLNANELGLVEGSGFAKESPTMQKMIFKKVTKPYQNSIVGPQNTQALPRIRGGLSGTIDTNVRLELERFDPVQEAVERQETMDEWREKAVSLNELRGELGREATEFVVEIEELGGEVNIADVPRYMIDLFLDQTNPFAPEGGSSGTTESQSGPPDFENDPVVSEEEAFAKHGVPYSERAVKQLDNTIDVKSSFIKSTAYSEETDFMQITFSRPGEQDAIYWYGGVERFRFFNFLRADSKGSYFNRYIRHTGDPGYPYARVQ